MRLVLIDALNLVRRVYAAQPGEDGPERVEGALAACLGSLRRAIAECAPSHAVCVFEGEGRSWRHELHAGYKEGHAPMPPALEAALESYREAFAAVGIRSLALPGLEADDVISTMAVKARAAGVAVVVLSTDRAFVQLVAHGVEVRDHFRGLTLDRAHVREKYGVDPEQMADFLALCGDRTSGIPGVPGIGAKTARRLLREHVSLERMLATPGEIAAAPARRLAGHAEAARLSLRLVTLRTDLDLGLSLADFRCQPGG